ncbi:hypothetical protein Tco_1242816 [Tanacetum coccineum]
MRAQQLATATVAAAFVSVRQWLAATVAATRWLVAKAGSSYQPAAAFIILTRPFGAIMFDPPMQHLVLLSSNDGRMISERILKSKRAKTSQNRQETEKTSTRERFEAIFRSWKRK